MSLGLYMDEHVPGAVTWGLRERGVEVLTAGEDDRDGNQDTQLLDRATELRMAVFTQDQGYFREAAERQRAGASFSGIFFSAQHALSYRTIIDELELVAQCSEWDEWNGQINSLPLKR